MVPGREARTTRGARHGRRNGRRPTNRGCLCGLGVHCRPPRTESPRLLAVGRAFRQPPRRKRLLRLCTLVATVFLWLVRQPVSGWCQSTPAPPGPLPSAAPTASNTSSPPAGLPSPAARSEGSPRRSPPPTRPARPVSRSVGDASGRSSSAGPSQPGANRAAVRVVSQFWSEGFEANRPAWAAVPTRSAVPLQFTQTRTTASAHSGQAAAELRLAPGQAGRVVQLVYALPPSRVLDDLTFSLWVRASRPGIRLALRLQFPGQTDPTTGGPLTLLVYGDVYSQVGQWQRLQCRTDGSRVRERLRWLRARVRPVPVDERRMFVDAAVLELPPLDQSELVVVTDDLQFGPVVPPGEVPAAPTFPQPSVTRPTVEFRLDQLLVGGRPVLPRIVPYHGEPPEKLKQWGFNLVWIPDWRDTALISRLRDQGLWPIATPPRPVASDGHSLDRSRAALVPFGPETTDILAWYMGTRVSPEQADQLIEWVDQVKEADRLLRRPVLADIAGAERTLSRHLSMTGISRHVVHTAFPFLWYRQWLNRRRKLARPGCFVWTWVQTEPRSSERQWRQTAGRQPLVVEYEQLRLQVYAALAAGYRGIGYWTRSPLDGDSTADRERRLSIALLNLELQLIEPWVSTGTLADQIPFQVVGDSTLQASRRTPRPRPLTLAGYVDSLRSVPQTNRASEFQAAVIRSGDTLLLLPVWYDQDAQFVPGALVAKQIRLLVPGVPEASFAWSVTTTGVQPLRTERVTGGVSILVPDFDQTGIVLISPNYSLGEQLRQKVESIQAESARLWIELARTKLKRVQTVDAELSRLGVGQTRAAYWLREADALIDQAEQLYQRASRQSDGVRPDPVVRLFQQQDYDEARRKCTQALQLVRIVERAHWKNAVRNETSPVATPYTVCFQTLPDYWRLVRRLGRGSIETSQNLLPEGSFDRVEPEELIARGWRHQQHTTEGIRAVAELALVQPRSNYALRLVAGPMTNVDPPQVLPRPPVQVVTAPIPVRAGQIVHVSGKVRLTTPVQSSLDGFTIHDSLLGPPAALRWTQPAGWKPFELVREVDRDGTLTLTFTLHGLGEVEVDDLKVVTVEEQPAEPGKPPAKDKPSPWLSPWNLIHRLPGLKRP